MNHNYDIVYIYAIIYALYSAFHANMRKKKKESYLILGVKQPEIVKFFVR